MQNLVKIKLWGDLGKNCGSDWKLAVNSVSEAIRAIEMNSHNKLYKYLLEKDKEGVKYKVIINGRTITYENEPTPENPEPAFKSELAVKFNNDSLKTIDIVPVIEGADSGIFATILGVVLIIVGIVVALIPGFQPLGVAIIIGGLGLLAAGVTALLSKPPKFDDFREIDGQTGRTSYLFNGPQNTTREGGPVPIGYGRLLIGSQVISASYVVKNIDAGTIISTTVIPTTAGDLDLGFRPAIFQGDRISDPTAFFTIGRDNNNSLLSIPYIHALFNTFPNLVKLKKDGSPNDDVVNLNFDTFFKNYRETTQYRNQVNKISIGILNESKFDIGDIYALESLPSQNGDITLIGGNFYLYKHIVISISSSIELDFAKHFACINTDGKATPIGPNANLLGLEHHVQPYRPNNAVNAIYVYPNGNGNQFQGQALIAGKFTKIQYVNFDNIIDTPKIVRLGKVDGFGNLDFFGGIDPTFSSSLSVTGGDIYCIAVDTNNNIYIGGDFTTVNGNTRKGIAKLSPHGVFDSSFPDLDLKYMDKDGVLQNAKVFSIAIHQQGINQDKIVLGGNFTRGNFTNVGVSTRNLIARVDSAGNLDTTVNFSTDITPSENALFKVNTLSIQYIDQKILIGGLFDYVNGLRYNNIVRINSDGSVDTNFNVATETTDNTVKRVGTDNEVKKIYIDETDGKIYVSGLFTRYGDSSVYGVIRLNNGGYLG